MKNEEKNEKKVFTHNASQNEQVNTTTNMDNKSETGKSQEKKLNEIIRVKKRPSNFVIIDKTFLEDDRLSYKAKGILAYLLSKPDNWKVIVSDLVKHSKDGFDSVYSGLKELKKYGYYEKNPIRDEKGIIIRWESIIYEVPKIKETNQTHETSLLRDFPDMGFPDMENPEHNNNYINNNKLNNNDSNLSDLTGLDENGLESVDTLAAYETLIKKNIEYENLCNSHQYDVKFIDEIVSNILDVVMSHSKTIKIANEYKNVELVKSVLLKLNYYQIEHVIQKYHQITTRITNKRQYILTMLYNARLESESSVINDVNVDMFLPNMEDRDRDDKKKDIENLENYLL